LESNQLLEIYQQGLIGTLYCLNVPPWSVIFQQDNDSKHRAWKAQNWLKEHQIPIVDWPAQSPDLSPIKNVWDKINKHVQKLKLCCQTSNDLYAAIEWIWYSEDFQKYVIHTYNSFPQRLIALRDAEGSWTKY